MASKKKKRKRLVGYKKLRNGKTNLDWAPSNRLHSTVKRMLKADFLTTKYTQCQNQEKEN